MSVQELAQLQSSHQALEQQLNQTRTKLTQEIQQSKKDYNILQADMEKVTSLFCSALFCSSVTNTNSFFTYQHANVSLNLVVSCSSYSSLLLSLTLFSCSVTDEFPEESDGEGGGGAQTETAEVRAEPPGQPDQRAGPPQENGGGPYCHVSEMSFVSVGSTTLASKGKHKVQLLICLA